MLQFLDLYFVPPASSTRTTPTPKISKKKKLNEHFFTLFVHKFQQNQYEHT